MTSPSNSIWFALAGFAIAALVVVGVERRARRGRHLDEAPEAEVGYGDDARNSGS